jgi:hypothetical protein
MKNKIFDRANEITSGDRLKKIIEEIFFDNESIKRAIQNCYYSMPDRIKAVIERKGGHCGY